MFDRGFHVRGRVPTCSLGGVEGAPRAIQRWSRGRSHELLNTPALL